MSENLVLGKNCRTRYAKYLKEVDFEENTLRFWQEIYNEQGELVEIHEKYPADKGHQKVESDE